MGYKYIIRREPVGNTCPDIDEAIAILEKLREANTELRDWGNKEAIRVDELESENDDLKNKIEKLENENNDLKIQLSDLDTQ